MRVVIALGGNAMTAPDGSATPEAQQRGHRRGPWGTIADVVAPATEVVLTHGNGPQVGQPAGQERAGRATVVPPVPLDWCGAQTQATIGFMIARRAGRRRWPRAGCPGRPPALVTRTLVAADDPAFAERLQADRPVPAARPRPPR